MKVVLLGNAKSTHVVRWANGLSRRGLGVIVISLDFPFSKDLFDSTVSIIKLKGKPPLGYYYSFLELRNLLKKISPDLLNVHYASGYGTLARLARFHPTMLSVWGSDVYLFPRKSKLHWTIIRNNLSFADGIGSTSNAMLHETSTIYSHIKSFVTPFGIDTDLFKPISESGQKDEVIIGTVKTLAAVYGIDVLIKAFSIVKDKLPAIRLKLIIVGSGPEENNLKTLVLELGLKDSVEFYGFVDNNKVPAILQKFDVYVTLSHSESFGVAILEASACGVPVVVSDADGPAEVVIDGTTGFVVTKNDEHAAANALEKLIVNSELRKSMGMNGRAHVMKNYSWEKSLNIMIDAYEKTCERG